MSDSPESLHNDNTNGITLEPGLTDDYGSNEENGAQDDDLFGDDEDGEQHVEQPAIRTLDDEELDSGDDEDRHDRHEAIIEEDQAQREVKIIEADIARIDLPEGNEMYALNMPGYLGLQHRNFDYDNYEVPSVAHDGDTERKFSPYSAAMTSMFWRRDPKQPESLQSSARIVRWSDGSLTLQLATKPQEHYRIETKPVRQGFAFKDVPKSQQPSIYDPSKDSHMYLAAYHNTNGVDLQIVRAVDATMKILPTGEQTDESILRLKSTLAAARADHDPLARIKVVEEDPELAKKAAEAFEKEKARTVRKREAAEDRSFMRRDKVLGRSGVSGYGRSAGLSVAGLEDDDGMPSTHTKTKRRKTNRRGDIYSDGEDSDAPRGRTREDEYDMADDFLADSDEEPETYEDGQDEEILDEDDPDNDDLEIDGRETVIEDRTRGNKKPRSRMDEIEANDEDDAEAEPDDDFARQQALAAAGGGGRRRRVVEDDDEE